MHRLPQVGIKHLSYSIPDTLVQFENLTLTFDQRHYGIVGDNGVGKTTLLKLIANVILPQHGSIQSNGIIAYCPQNAEDYFSNATIADVLNITTKLQALNRIHQGDLAPENYEIIDNDWDIEERAKKILCDFAWFDIDFDRHFSSLSGGQKTKCLLARVILAKADFILLDEPTNNLDQQSRRKLYDWIQNTKQGLLIVSHDRTLLDFMDEIIEITSKGFNRYGGNYNFYQKQKAIHQGALANQLLDAKRKIKNTQYSIQQTYERHAQRGRKGRLLRKQGKVDKLTANSMRGRSEKSQSRNTTQAEQMINKAQEILTTAKSQIEIKESIQADLSATEVPNGKIVLAIEKLYFSYCGQPNLFKNFNLTITGPERVAIMGNNGSGKTTLIKLILGGIKPHKGSIKCDVSPVCYLDQQINFLSPSLSLIDNFQYLNPDISTQDAYFALASFNFRSKETEKLARYLSGGERLRAGLAISLLSKVPPQLIILDEPTNHLDIRSIEAIETALLAYKGGAIIVISHDQRFLENIGIFKKIQL